MLRVARSLTFLGAAGTVTGSKHLVRLPNDKELMVDCGLFQGPKTWRLKNWEPLPVPAPHLEWLALTHAHLDHCGFLPRLAAGGFLGGADANAGRCQERCRAVGIRELEIGAQLEKGSHEGDVGSGSSGDQRRRPSAAEDATPRRTLLLGQIDVRTKGDQLLHKLEARELAGADGRWIAVLAIAKLIFEIHDIIPSLRLRFGRFRQCHDLCFQHFTVGTQRLIFCLQTR